MGFHRKAPASPFPLTQIEMKGNFPLDSSTCESRTLCRKLRRNSERLWPHLDAFVGTQSGPGVGRVFSTTSAARRCSSQRRLDRSLCADPILLSGDLRFLSALFCRLLALPSRRWRKSRSEPSAAALGVRSLLATPVIVGTEAIGAITFLHNSDDNFFNQDISSKATILAGQLGSLLEAIRLNEASREEHRRAEILADVAHALHGTPDVSAVIEAVADRLRLLLRTQLVCVLLKRDGPFELRAVSAETPQLANLARARHDRQTLRFAANLAQRAVSAGEPITLSIGAEVHSLGNLAGSGMLIAAPLRTSRTQGAILVYPRQDGGYTAEERALVSAITGFGAGAVAHAELYSTAHAQAHELHQLLEISSSLSSSRDLDHFLQSFVVHAADFLGYGRCFIALLKDDQFKVQYAVEKGEARPVETIFPEGVATRALRNKEVFSTDDIGSLPGVNLEVLMPFKAK